MQMIYQTVKESSRKHDTNNCVRSVLGYTFDGVFAQKVAEGEIERVKESTAAVTDRASRLLPNCSDIQLKLEGKNVQVNTSNITNFDLKKELEYLLQAGGLYSPEDCEPPDKTAIIIPYRDRMNNLLTLLRNLVPILVRQRIHFRIFVVEQTSEYPFNRCLLFNVGFVESMKVDNFTCVILHDVDLIPRRYDNLYQCHPQRPRHFVRDRSNKEIRGLPYRGFIGGVLAMRRWQVEKINGCSNMYYGWGKEDDDLYKRLCAVMLKPVRYDNPALGEYIALGHSKQQKNKLRNVMLRGAKIRMAEDGLSSLSYTRVNFLERELYTWLLVRVPPPPPPRRPRARFH
ncbi:hypothetical protein V1264_009158 [Littorina saxatilis]